MKLLMENWKQFIQEVSEDDIAELSQVLSTKIRKYLPFDDVFDGKMRTVIPLNAPSDDKKTWTDMRNWFSTSGDWYFDGQNPGSGIVKRTVYRTIPKGPRAGEEIRSEEKKKVGKLLKPLVDFSDWLEKLKARSDKRIPTLPMHLKQPDLYHGKDVYDKIKAMDDYTSKNFLYGGARPDVAWRAKDYYDFWQKYSEILKADPKALDAVSEHPDKTIVVSRHPIDVMRMSDFAHIQSCHSRGGGYWDCAVDEAKGGGLIAYVVSKQDLEGVDLEQNEIFEDVDRGVRGIKPHSRVRLRRIVNKETKEDFAVPEMRLYGDKQAGFVSTMRNWVLEKQPDIKKLEGDELKKFVYVGGKYADNEPEDLLGHMGIRSDVLVPYKKGFESPQARFRQKEFARVIPQLNKDFKHKRISYGVEFLMLPSGHLGFKSFLNLKGIDEHYEGFDWDLLKNKQAFATRDLYNIINSHLSITMQRQFPGLVRDKAMIGKRGPVEIKFYMVPTREWGGSFGEHSNAIVFETMINLEVDLKDEGKKRVLYSYIEAFFKSLHNFQFDVEAKLREELKKHLKMRGAVDTFMMRENIETLQETFDEWRKYLQRKTS